jgi:hypothetical protein
VHAVHLLGQPQQRRGGRCGAQTSTSGVGRMLPELRSACSIGATSTVRS